MDWSELHQQLLEPATYPHHPERITCSETHISRLYFAGPFVYKIKKPVNFGFLDFSTRERRAHFCHEEVRLNARFAPGTYLHVADIHRSSSGKINFRGVGACIEHAVVMAHLPQERMLTELLRRQAPELPEEMQRLARRLAVLHRESPQAGESAVESVALLRQNWAENFSQMLQNPGDTLHTSAHSVLSRAVDAYLETAAPLMLSRAERGMVRDGHGDLHAEHICLTDPICIYDCIEFNRRFRVADIITDIAFLLMDLDFRQRSDLAALLWQTWTAELGEDPEETRSLLRFAKIYRAFVRGKVDSFLAADPNAAAPTRATAAAAARQYFNLALGYLVTPTMILTCGLMGVGKSTLARTLGAALGAGTFRSDVVRKELAGIAPRVAVSDAYGTGLYSAASSAATYRQLLELSLEELATGHCAIVDAAFLRRADREAFRLAAASRGIRCRLIHVTCPPELSLQRLGERQARADDPSDGRIELVSAQTAAFEYPQADEEPITVDSRSDVDYNVQTILCRLTHW